MLDRISTGHRDSAFQFDFDLALFAWRYAKNVAYGVAKALLGGHILCIGLFGVIAIVRTRICNSINDDRNMAEL